MSTALPEGIDLYSDEVLSDPYPVYELLRESGAAVWLARHEVFALPRYAEVRSALGDWELYSSAQGVALNPVMNSVRGVLNLDPPEHDHERETLLRPMSRQALEDVEARIAEEAERLVDAALAAGEIDGVSEFAQRIPLLIVAELVGLPDSGRARMLDWAADGFNVQGPLNERTESGLAGLAEVRHYLAAEVVPDNVLPGSWAAYAFEQGERESLSVEQVQLMLLAYVIPSLDTTIQAMANALWLFATHPDQWDLVRSDPALVNRAINEVLRMESPVQTFSRVLTRDHEIDGVELSAGARVLVMFASANRDRLHWSEPDRFDVGREGSAQHLAFGFGQHVCIGQGLARIELRAQLAALARRVSRIELEGYERALNNTLRGFARLDLRLFP